MTISLRTTSFISALSKCRLERWATSYRRASMGRCSYFNVPPGRYQSRVAILVVEQPNALPCWRDDGRHLEG